MTSYPFSSLPVEVLETVAKHAPKESLKNLRVVSKKFSDIAERWLFYSIKIPAIDDSFDNFQRILNSSNLKHLVHQVTVVTFPYGDDLSDSETEDIWWSSQKPFRVSLEQLGQFPNLESVNVIFTEAVACTMNWGHQVEPYPAERVELRQKILLSLFRGLGDEQSPALKLKSLSIKNLQDINDARVVNSKEFGRVLERIQELRLRITTENDSDLDTSRFELEDLHRFFLQLPGTWLAPCKNLRRLAIHCRDYWGYYPKVDWRSVRLPQLTSLDLGSYTFTQEWQIDWICNMKELRELIFDECAIVASGTGYNLSSENFIQRQLSGRQKKRKWINEKRWRDYFEKIGNELPHLRKLVFGSGQSVDQVDLEDDFGGLDGVYDENSDEYDAYVKQVPFIGLPEMRYMQFEHDAGECDSPWHEFNLDDDEEFYAERIDEHGETFLDEIDGPEERKDREAFDKLQNLVRSRR